jgi:hypothetical protein
MPMVKVMSLPESTRSRRSAGVRKLAGRLEVAAGQGLEHRQFQLDAVEELLVLGRRAGGGADHVAEVVEHEPGHHGVEVDHAHGFAGVPSSMTLLNLVSLWVTRTGTSPRASASTRADTSGFMPRANSISWRARSAAMKFIRLDCPEQTLESFGGVVKVRNRGRQFSRRQVRQKALKLTERVSGLVGLPG